MSPGINKLFWNKQKLSRDFGVVPSGHPKDVTINGKLGEWDNFLLLPVLGVFLTPCRLQLAFMGRLAWDHLRWDLSHLTADVDKMGGSDHHFLEKRRPRGTSWLSTNP